jgi:apolipoprotein N-acyltransferase
MLYIVLSVISGLTLSISLPNYYIPFAFLVGYGLLFYLIEKNDTKRLILYSFIAGFIFSAISFYWIIYAIHYYGKIDLYLSSGLFLLFITAYSLYTFVLFSILLKLFYKRYNYKGFFISPFLMVLLEVVREYFPFTGFPWNLNGYMLSYINQIAQISSLFSIYGLSFFVLYFSVSFYMMFSNQHFRWIILNLLNIALFISIFLWGQSKIESYADKGESYKISILQGNIDETLKIERNTENDMIVLDKYISLFEKAKKDNPDLIILPESALPFFPFIDNDKKEYFFKEFEKIKIPFLSGFDNVILNKNLEIGKVYNSLFLVDENGKYVDYYSKIKIVPFAEYSPIRFKFLEEIFEYMKGIDFSPGEGQKLLTFQKNGKRPMKIVSLICFESVFPNYVSSFVNKGGNVIVNITNDGWFGKTSAPYQHFEMARIRAIENNVYLIRAANTGISAIINPVGKIKSKLNLNTEGVLTDYVYLTDGRSFFNQNRIFILIGYMVLFGLVLGLLEFYKARSER